MKAIAGTITRLQRGVVRGVHRVPIGSVEMRDDPWGSIRTWLFYLGTIMHGTALPKGRMVTAFLQEAFSIWIHGDERVDPFGTFLEVGR